MYVFEMPSYNCAGEIDTNGDNYCDNCWNNGYKYRFHLCIFILRHFHRFRICRRGFFVNLSLLFLTIFNFFV